MLTRRPVALTVAGSDCCGGAGVQADLRVFARFGVFGASAITVATAQDPRGPVEVMALPAPAVDRQVRRAARALPLGAVKTGMLWSPEIVETVAGLVCDLGLAPLVVDPVLRSSTGSLLAQGGTLDAYRQLLLPRATLFTPNLEEASALLEAPITSEREMTNAAASLGRLFGCAVLLKGGHLEGEPRDVLWTGGETCWWRHPRIRRPSLVAHGTGCILSAAIAADLARGAPLVEACGAAVCFVAAALRRPVSLTDDLALPGIERAGADSPCAGEAGQLMRSLAHAPHAHAAQHDEQQQEGGERHEPEGDEAADQL